MAKYEMRRRISATETEKVTLPIDTIDGLATALDANLWSLYDVGTINSLGETTISGLSDELMQYLVIIQGNSGETTYDYNILLFKNKGNNSCRNALQIYFNLNDIVWLNVDVHISSEGLLRIKFYNGAEDITSSVYTMIDSITVYKKPVPEKYAVSFYNGDTLLETAIVDKGATAVYSGDTPTKTETPQYTFEFSGWGLADGGEVDNTILTNITQSKKVYAIYTETLRTYTVRFFNGDTLLETDLNIPYGGSTTYDGEEPLSDIEDFVFNGWLPEPTNIQGDTDCYAQFRDTSSKSLKFIERTIVVAESDTVTRLGSYAFYQCSSLTTADFPNATSIGKYAFYSCTSLTSVVIGTNKTTVCTLSNANAFSNTPIASRTGYIYVPDNLVDQYKSATNWSTYANQIKGISELED